MTTIKLWIIILGYSALCLGSSIAISHCSGKITAKKVAAAKEETERLKADLNAVNAQLLALENRMDRELTALEFANLGALEALESDKERINAIKNDDSASDWLKCPVPECVRAAFTPGGGAGNP